MEPSQNTRKKRLRYGLFLLVLAGFYSCDVLESDVAPQTPEVEITGNEIYITPNGAGYIDLYSLVKSSGTVRLDITGQPSKGDLTELTKGLLQYSPGLNFIKGHDSFEFAIYSNTNKLLKRDTVIIIVEPDSTHLPCGIYAMNDYIHNPTADTVINVLGNDIICGDSTHVAIKIYRPDPSFPPHSGTAVVVDNRIRYTPGSSFNGYDKIVYRVFDTQDSTRFSIGIVYITPPAACNFAIYNDNHVFKMDSLASDSVSYDTLQLPVFNNDQLCGRPVTHYQLLMLHDGEVGTAHFQQNGDDVEIAYDLPQSPPRTFSDSLVYRLCYEAQCQTAKVYIQVKD